MLIGLYPIAGGSIFGQTVDLTGSVDVSQLTTVVVYDLQDGAAVSQNSVIVVYDLQDGVAVSQSSVIVVYKDVT